MQSKKHSFIEQVFNVGTGFIISCLIWAFALAPLIKLGILNVDNTLIITGVFTIVSVCRGYIFRRIGNWHTQKQVKKHEIEILAQYGRDPN